MRAEPADPASVRWEHALLRFLANEIEQVVAPLAALDGSTFYVDCGHVVPSFRFSRARKCGLTKRSSDKSCRRCSHVYIDALRQWPVTEQRPGVPSLRDRDWDRNDWWDWSLVESRRHWCGRSRNCASGSRPPTICASARSTVTSTRETSSCAMGALPASSIGSTRAGTGLLLNWLGWSGTCDGTAVRRRSITLSVMTSFRSTSTRAALARLPQSCR